ncbi:MAG: hypothetical protein FJX74_10095 [Armatimonadetes bacterium]|nr:hypothetical protein [Armatimonadota bacterium]
MPRVRLRLLALLLIVGLTALSAYAGCRQLHEVPPGDRPVDRIEAVDAIRAYVQRVESALRSTEEAPVSDDVPARSQE